MNTHLTEAGLLCASSRNVIKIWDPMRRTSMFKDIFNSADSEITALCWKLDGQSIIYGCASGKIYLFNIGSPQSPPASQTLGTSSIVKICLTKDSLALMTGHKDGTIAMWNFKTRALVQQIKELNMQMEDMAISDIDQNKNLYIATSHLSGDVILYKANEKEILKLGRCHDDSIKKRTFVTFSDSLSSHQPQENFASSKNHQTGNVSKIQNLHLAAGGDDGSVSVWHVEQRLLIFRQTLHDGSVTGIHIDESDTKEPLLFSCGIDGRFVITNYKTQQVIETRDLKCGITCMSYNGDLGLIAFGKSNGEVQTYNIGKLNQPVSSCIVHPTESSKIKTISWHCSKSVQSKAQKIKSEVSQSIASNGWSSVKGMTKKFKGVLHGLTQEDFNGEKTYNICSSSALSKYAPCKDDLLQKNPSWPFSPVPEEEGRDKESRRVPARTGNRVFQALEQLTPVKRRSDTFDKNTEIQQKREIRKETPKKKLLDVSQRLSSLKKPSERLSILRPMVFENHQGSWSGKKKMKRSPYLQDDNMDKFNEREIEEIKKNMVFDEEEASERVIEKVLLKLKEEDLIKQQTDKDYWKKEFLTMKDYFTSMHIELIKQFHLQQEESYILFTKLQEEIIKLSGRVEKLENNSKAQFNDNLDFMYK